MIRKYFFLVCGIYFFLHAARGAADSWTTIPSPTTANLHAVIFPSSAFGYCCGDDGLVFKTTNAGTSWSKQRFAVGFAGAMRGVATLDTSFAVSAGDAGEISYSMANTIPWHASQPFLDSLNTIVETPWSIDSIGNDPSDQFTMHVTRFVAAGAHGTQENIRLVHYLAHYLSGGTWMDLDSTFLTFGELPFNTTAALHGEAFDFSNGYLVGDSGTIVLSHDQGTSWNVRHISVSAMLKSVCIVSFSTVIAIGDSGNIWMSGDSGTTWKNISPAGLHENLCGISFADTTTGVIVGTNGLIIKSNDGGATWQRQAVNTFQNLNAVCCYQGLDGSNWIAVGDSGTIVQTFFGGSVAMFTQSRDSIAFGDVAGFTSVDSIITITNNSSISPATISCASSSAAIRAVPNRVIIDPQSAAMIKIYYQPQDTSSLKAIVLLTTDASWIPDTVRVSGRGILAMSEGLTDTIHATADTVDSVALRSAGNIPLTASVKYISDTTFSVTCDSIASPGQTISVHVTILHRTAATQLAYFVLQTNVHGHLLDTMFVVINGTSSAVAEKSTQPDENIILENFPNPVSRSTTIIFAVKNRDDIGKDILLVVRDPLGRALQTLFSGSANGQRHEIEINTEKYFSGIYFCEMTCGEERLVKTIVVRK